MAAARHEHHDDVVAVREVVDAGADLLDDARRLVAERHRHRPRPVAVDHRQVRVAQPGGRDLDQDLARPGRIELDLSIFSGFDSAYGAGAPIWLSTAALIFMLRCPVSFWPCRFRSFNSGATELSGLLVQFLDLRLEEALL